MAGFGAVVSFDVAGRRRARRRRLPIGADHPPCHEPGRRRVDHRTPSRHSRPDPPSARTAAAQRRMRAPRRPLARPPTGPNAVTLPAPDLVDARRRPSSRERERAPQCYSGISDELNLQGWLSCTQPAPGPFRRHTRAQDLALVSRIAEHHDARCVVHVRRKPIRRQRAGRRHARLPTTRARLGLLDPLAPFRQAGLSSPDSSEPASSRHCSLPTTPKTPSARTTPSNCTRAAASSATATSTAQAPSPRAKSTA